MVFKDHFHSFPLLGGGEPTIGRVLIIILLLSSCAGLEAEGTDVILSKFRQSHYGHNIKVILKVLAVIEAEEVWL